jgi:hypothetical protein
MGSARASSNLVGVDIRWLYPSWVCLFFFLYANTSNKTVSSDLGEPVGGHKREREARFYSVIG